MTRIINNPYATCARCGQLVRVTTIRGVEQLARHEIGRRIVGSHMTRRHETSAKVCKSSNTADFDRNTIVYRAEEYL